MNDILAKSKPFQSVIRYTNVNSTRALKCDQKSPSLWFCFGGFDPFEVFDINGVCRSEYAGKRNKF